MPVNEFTDEVFEREINVFNHSTSQPSVSITRVFNTRFSHHLTELQLQIRPTHIPWDVQPEQTLFSLLVCVFIRVNEQRRLSHGYRLPRESLSICRVSVFWCCCCQGLVLFSVDGLLIRLRGVFRFTGARAGAPTCLSEAVPVQMSKNTCVEQSFICCQVFGWKC